jgi:DNA polymerase III gamma/tau subunit
MEEPLHTKYRPTRLEDVVGQSHLVSSLAQMLAKFNKTGQAPHAFLFTGPSGTGKTTLARILAGAFKVSPQGLVEIDGATNSGVADMRSITDAVRHRSFGEGGRKFVIVDECHALSKQTWQSLLKPIEEPPAHVWYALCTTEPEKVPETIRTRCVGYALRGVSDDDIGDLLSKVRDAEKLSTSDELLGVIARQAQGSPRRALVYLQTAGHVKDKREALRLLETGVGEEEEAVALARMLCTGRGATWPKAMEILKKLQGDSPEGIRLVVLAYASKMLPTAKEPEPLLAVLQAFREPCRASEGFAPLYLAVGELLLS